MRLLLYRYENVKILLQLLLTHIILAEYHQKLVS